MIKQFFIFLITLFCSVLGNYAFGQQKYADSVKLHPVNLNMRNDFNKTIDNQSRLYNGYSYQMYDIRHSVGNAYFNDTTSLVNGTVNYDGIVYTDVPLIYDLYKDILVSRVPSGFLYGLLMERVSEFDMLGHHFIRLQTGNSTKLLPAGIYDELYSGNLRLLARRTKDIQKSLRNRELITTYYTENNYFLKKGDIYYDVNSRGKLFDVLKDKKKELKKYLKDKNLSYADNPEQVMIALANYYDQLTK